MRRQASGKGQLVLVAAILVAVALIPLVVASLQLGYDADREAIQSADSPLKDAKRVLGHAIRRVEVNGSWNTTVIRSRLQPSITALERSRSVPGGVYQVSYNKSTAKRWAKESCPQGPTRRFGPCRAQRGVILQKRSGEIQLVGVAYTVTILTEHGQLSTTLIVPGAQTAVDKADSETKSRRLSLVVSMLLS